MLKMAKPVKYKDYDSPSQKSGYSHALEEATFHTEGDIFVEEVAERFQSGRGAIKVESLFLDITGDGPRHRAVTEEIPEEGDRGKTADEEEVLGDQALSILGKTKIIFIGSETEEGK